MRYRVLDLPPVGAGAFTPIPTTTPVASSHGLVHVCGSPGTEPIPSPSPKRTWLPNLTRRPPPDTAQDSDCAPDVILPSLYVAGTQNMGPSQHFGMATRRVNPLPVPSWSYPATPRPTQRRPHIGGRATMVTPRPFQRYPAVNCPTPAGR